MPSKKFALTSLSAAVRLRPPGRFHPLLLSVWCLLLTPLAMPAQAPTGVGPLRVVIVGGGPTREYNQVAIESNVRYVGRLLPPDAVRTTLFADGDKERATVLYEEEAPDLSSGERVLTLLLNGEDGGSKLHYRQPNVGGSLDGASKQADIRRVFTQLRSEAAAQTSPIPLLLYFTGHGSPVKSEEYENNVYDLWGDKERLSVRDLARYISALPDTIPITVVMVQCFSGAFGNLLFEDGDPKGQALDRDIAGFFATVKERVAAGCTPAINEAEYRDFTSYFFAALTGRDRVGRKVTGADYNKDGRVGMDEAYCYALANDESIDVPTCTSDVFLRRFVTHKDSETFKTSYHLVRSWATPGQQAALDALAARLNFQGDNSPAEAWRKENSHNEGSAPQDAVNSAYQRLHALREEGKRTVLARWPDLRYPDQNEYGKAKTEAISALAKQADDGKWDALLHAEDAYQKANDTSYAQELNDARLLRFVRLCNSVVLAHKLRDSDDTTLKARYARLVEAEGRTLLPPADSIKGAFRGKSEVAGSLNTPAPYCPCEGAERGR